jgi:hypothetical protein
MHLGSLSLPSLVLPAQHLGLSLHAELRLLLHRLMLAQAGAPGAQVVLGADCQCLVGCWVLPQPAELVWMEAQQPGPCCHQPECWSYHHLLLLLQALRQAVLAAGAGADVHSRCQCYCNWVLGLLVAAAAVALCLLQLQMQFQMSGFCLPPCLQAPAAGYHLRLCV